MLILDGLDEMPDALRMTATTRINDSLQPGEHVVVTCRTTVCLCFVGDDGESAIVRHIDDEAALRGAAGMRKVWARRRLLEAEPSCPDWHSRMARCDSMRWTMASLNLSTAVTRYARPTTPRRSFTMLSARTFSLPRRGISHAFCV